LLYHVLMKEDTNFLFLGNMPDFDDVLSSVNLLTQNDWLSYKERKNLGGVAGGYTDTIPLLYGTRDVLSSQRKHEMFSVFSEAVWRICHIYSACIHDSSPARAFLARMTPNSEIGRHKDKGEVSAKTHRIHLPIITNPACLFTVDSETEHLAAGELWLIDNTDKYHSVVNGGSEYRVHLILDVTHV